MKQLSRKKLAAAVAFACATLPYQAAHAQAAPDAAPADPAKASELPAPSAPIPAKPDDGKRHLETINVSAEKVTGFKVNTTQVGAFRDAQILDVPATINVIPRTMLDAQAATGIFDALKNTAGVVRAQTNGAFADNVSIRGLQVENRTSWRLNGGLSVSNLIEIPMEDKERIEVLKGSSALYYGFTTPAGIINMVTKRAQAEPITTLIISGNEFGSIQGHFDAGRQFGEKNQFGARVNFMNGETRNAIDGFRGWRQLAAGAFDWRVTDTISIRVDLEKSRRSAIEQSAFGVNAAVNNVIVVPAPPDPTKLLSGRWAWTSGTVTNKQARADWAISPDWSLMVETGHAETNRDRRASSTLQNYNIATGAGQLRFALTKNQVYTNRNDRLELDGHFSTWILEHDISVGYMGNERYQTGPSQQAITIAQNFLNPVEIPEQFLTATLVNSPQYITDKGIYVMDRVRIGSMVQVLAGGRRTDYSNVSVTGTYEVKNTTPSYALIFQPRPHTSIYGSYIEGLEEGGTAPLTTVNGGQVLSPGVSKQKEVGVRSEWIPGLQLSAAYFDVNRQSAYTNTANVFVLDGRTHYKGVEYSVVGQVGREWQVYLSGLFMDAKQESAQNAALIGKAPDATAEKAHNVFVEYQPGWLPRFAINAGVNYVGPRFINALEQGSIPGYSIINAGARYGWKVGRTAMQLQLNVDNLGDKRYWSGAGGGILAVGLPRTIKAQLRIDL